jgi:hypothetical protein
VCVLSLPGGLAVPVSAQPQHAALPDEQSTYFCPMHPGVRGPQAGSCPRCGMALIVARGALTDRFSLEVQTEPRAPTPGRPVQLAFLVRHALSGDVVRAYLPVHERPFHLFVVSEDLTHFDHIHPELGDDGVLRVETILPVAGRYLLYADFVPQDGPPQFLASSVYTRGAPIDPMQPQPALAEDVEPKQADGVRVELQLPPGASLVAGEPQGFRMRFSTADRAPLTDLEPYLGAPAHLLLVSRGLDDAFHAHPSAEYSNPTGPNLVFEVTFLRPGLYRLWAQFQRHGRVHLVRFTVPVTAAP